MKRFFSKTFVLTSLFGFLLTGFLVVSEPAHAQLPALVPECASRTAEQVKQLGACNVCDALQVGVNITQLMLGLLGAAALLMFTYGGVLMVLSRGYSDQVQRGKETLYNATKGVIIVLGSWVVINYALAAILGVTDLSNVSLFGQTDKPWYKVACEASAVQTPSTNACVDEETGNNLTFGTACGTNMICNGAGRCITECEASPSPLPMSCQDTTIRIGGSSGCLTGLCPEGATILCCPSP